MKFRNGVGCWIVGMAACLAVTARGGEGEKVLFSFEKEEVEKIAQGKNNIAKFEDNGDILFFLERSSGANHELEMKAIRPMLLSREKASAGKYACKVVEQIDKGVAQNPSFRLPCCRMWTLHVAEPQANLRLPEIFNTAGWYNWAFPKDWTGYDLLRVDVCVETSEQVGKLMLEVEDAWVEPPASLTFEPPPKGEWVTLEMGLGQAVSDRHLDLKSMVNIWVRLVLKDLEETGALLHKLVRDPAKKDELEQKRFRAYVDNVRLARKGTPSACPVLKGTRSVYTAKLPRAYACEEHMLKDVFPAPMVVPTEFQPAGKGTFKGFNLTQRPTIVPASTNMPQEAQLEPVKGAVKLSGPTAAPIRDMIVKGCLDDKSENADIYNSVRLSCVAAPDPEHILVGFYIFGAGSLRAGPTAQTHLGRLCTAAIATLDGGKKWTGLDGSDWPTVMGGNISKVPPRITDLGGNIGGVAQFGCSAMAGVHIAYPADRMFLVRTVFTGDRYWKSPKYFVTGEPRHCHNVGSGDYFMAQSGRIWGTWAGLDRFSYGSVIDSSSTWVHYSDDGGVTWSGWRGPGFSGVVPFVGGRQIQIVPYRGQAAVIGQKGWTLFDGKEWSKPEKIGVQNHDAVSCGEEIYVSDETGPAKVYDGKDWKPFSVPGRTGVRGKIGVCGWKKAVFIEPDESGKKLLFWAKEGSEWRGPKELVSEQTPIVQVRVQRYAPERFIPVSYMCQSKGELPKHDGKKTYDIIYGFNQYPPRGTVHEPWIKALIAPVD